MKTLMLVSIIWVVLACTTLLLVIQNNSSLMAALVAWMGGVMTHILYEKIQLARVAQR